MSWNHQPEKCQTYVFYDRFVLRRPSDTYMSSWHAISNPSEKNKVLKNMGLPYDTFLSRDIHKYGIT